MPASVCHRRGLFFRRRIHVLVQRQTATGWYSAIRRTAKNALPGDDDRGESRLRWQFHNTISPSGRNRGGNSACRAGHKGQWRSGEETRSGAANRRNQCPSFYEPPEYALALGRGQRLSREALFRHPLGSEAVSEEVLRRRVPCRPFIVSDRPLQVPGQGRCIALA